MFYFIFLVSFFSPTDETHFKVHTCVCVYVLKKITLYKDRKMSTLFYICLCSSYTFYKKVFFTVMNPEIIGILLHISSQICKES